MQFSTSWKHAFAGVKVPLQVLCTNYLDMQNLDTMFIVHSESFSRVLATFSFHDCHSTQNLLFLLEKHPVCCSLWFSTTGDFYKPCTWRCKLRARRALPMMLLVSKSELWSLPESHALQSRDSRLSIAFNSTNIVQRWMFYFKHLTKHHLFVLLTIRLKFSVLLSKSFVAESEAKGRAENVFMSSRLHLITQNNTTSFISVHPSMFQIA